MNYRIRKYLKAAGCVLVLVCACLVMLIIQKRDYEIQMDSTEGLFREYETSDVVEEALVRESNGVDILIPENVIVESIAEEGRVAENGGGENKKQESDEIMGHSSNDTNLQDSFPGETESKDGKWIYVHVSGAVSYPDQVYKLPEGARVEEAVQAAGGLLESADLSSVNLAARLLDGMKLLIPAIGEESVQILQYDDTSASFQDETGTSHKDSEGKRASESERNGLTNINSASIMELDSLPGIGPALAQRIIDYREANGVFTSLEEIKNVKGIGEGLFGKLKDLISVD